MSDSNIFYNYDKVLSYNAFLNIIIGERGVGKTYGAKKYSINRWLKKRKQFVYIRRYETDLDESVGSSSDMKFFEQVRKEFPDHEFKITKSKKVRKLYIDNNICGYALPLSSADSLKSSSYDNVDTIIYDEFMLKEGATQHYLRNEPEAILDLIETVGRLKDVKVFLLGNAISSTAPIMSYFNVTLPYNSDIKLFKDGLILVNYIKNEAYREVKKKTKFGRLIDGTRYSKYAIDNEFLTDSKSFIRKKDESKFYFIFILNNKEYGVWRNKDDYIFISDDIDPNCPLKFALNVDDHDESSIFLKIRNNPYFDTIISHYRFAKLCFENQVIKNNVMNTLSRYLNY